MTCGAEEGGTYSGQERIEHLFGGDLDALRRALRWGSKDDEGTETAIRDLASQGYLADPHAAVAYGVLRERLQPGEVGVFLGTAHPAKFLPVYERMGIEIPVPEALAVLRERPIVAREIPADFEALREALENA